MKPGSPLADAPEADTPSARGHVWAIPVLVTIGSWLVLAFTASEIPIVWDEGEYLSRADGIIAWFRLLADARSAQGGLHAFSDAVIRDHWQFITWAEGHPAWFAIPIATTKALLAGVVSPLTAARLGPVTVFSLACGGVSWRLQRLAGPVAALSAPAAMLTLPRLFAEAHFATQDAQLTAWWLLLWAADATDRRGPRTGIVVGMLLGLTAATKFTGWLAWLPMLAWRLVSHQRATRRELTGIVPVALLTFVVVNPPLWHAPFDGMAEHVRLSVGRPDANFFGTAGARLPAVWASRQRQELSWRDYFVGSMAYDREHPYAPWYNTLAWLVVATPVPTLLLAVAGFRRRVRIATPASCSPPRGTWRDGLLRRIQEPHIVLLFAHWGILMVVRALPGAPANDGIRLFLPSFGFLCVFAALGTEHVWQAVRPGAASRGRRTLARAAVVAAFAAGAVNVGRYFPQDLSHYSVLVGGVRGAAALGLEPTYWWDALDDDVLQWLNGHTTRGRPVAFAMAADTNLYLLIQWGRLRTDIVHPDWGVPFQWYVLQNRPSVLDDVDRRLVARERPTFIKYAGRHSGQVPPDLDVPLLWIYSYDQYRRAAAGAP